MSDNSYGLGSGVFIRDVARVHRVSRRLRAGICWVNTYRAVSPMALFGGFKQSGYGREAGVEAMANPFVMRWGGWLAWRCRRYLSQRGHHIGS